jgi:DNA-binding NtrC family response regulator
METQTQLKFFIVDDDIFFANVYNQYLINLNYNDITLYVNGNDCINNLKQNPDIIFLNHNADDSSEFEVLKKIKSYNPNIYVIMIFEQENIKTVVDSLKFGAFDYVIKGIDINIKMALLIDKIISIKSQLKNNHNGFIKSVLSFF